MTFTIPKISFSRKAMPYSEFRSKFALNGLLYRKDSLSPVLDGFVESFSHLDASSEIILDRSFCNIARKPYGRNVNVDNLVVDGEDGTILWALQVLPAASSYVSLLRWKVDGDSHELLNRVALVNGDANYPYCCASVIYQTPMDIFVYVTRELSYTGSVIFRVSKQSLAVESQVPSVSWVFSDLTFFAKSSDYLYYIGPYITSGSNSYPFFMGYVPIYGALSGGSYGYSSIFDGGDFDPDFVACRAHGSKYNGALQCEAIPGGGGFIFLGSSKGREPNYGYPEFFRFSFDHRSKKISSAYARYSIVGLPSLLGQSHILPIAGSDLSYYLNLNRQLFFLEDNGHNYIVLVCCACSKHLNLVRELSFYKIMAFEDIGANVLELKSITFLERKYLGCLSSRDKKRFLFYDDTGVSAFVWDYFSQSYVKGDEIVCSMVQAGFDRDQRLVILDAENNLYIEDLPDAYSYRAEFVGVPESADFGEPVAAALRLDVPEGLGFLLKVELFGDVTFADESKVKVLGSDFGGGLIPVRVLSPTRGKVVVSKL